MILGVSRYIDEGGSARRRPERSTRSTGFRMARFRLRKKLTAVDRTVDNPSRLVNFKGRTFVSL